MKLVYKIIIGFFTLLVIFGVSMWITLSNNMKAIKEVSLDNIDFSRYEDGSYEGLYYYEDQIGAKVLVYIVDGKVDDIILIEHVYGLGKKAESILESVIAEQSLEVDHIAGATTSSKVILLAIENAMEGK